MLNYSSTHKNITLCNSAALAACKLPLTVPSISWEVWNISSEANEWGGIMHCAGSQTTALCLVLLVGNLPGTPTSWADWRTDGWVLSAKGLYWGEFESGLEYVKPPGSCISRDTCRFRFLLVKFRSTSSFGGPAAYWGTFCMTFALLRRRWGREGCSSLNYMQLIPRFCQKADASISLSLHHYYYLWLKKMRLHWLLASGCCSWHTQDHGSLSTSTTVHTWSLGSLPQHKHLVCSLKYWLNQTTFWPITRQKKPKPVTQPISGATQISSLKLWPTHPCQALLGTEASASDRNPSVECMEQDKGSPCLFALCLLCSCYSKHRFWCRRQWCSTVLFFQ